MFGKLNADFRKGKNKISEMLFIMESVMAVEEVLPGSEEEMDDVVDVDSVPEDAYNKIDKKLDEILNDPDYDDTDAEALLDGEDDDDDDIPDDVLEALMNEAVMLF